MHAQDFTIYDLDVNAPHQEFIDKIKEAKAPILAMSALITPSCVSMKEVVEALKENGLKDKTFVIIGGRFTTDLGRCVVSADAYGVEAVRLCKKYLQK